ncbi:MAG: PPC domain-containing protein [Planctomycetes bacterium]|nr:PPC domain-containing protein [Planctomycetota bacterium]
MTFYKRIELFSLLVFAIVNTAVAAPPTVDRLSPPGGKRGNTVTVSLSGKIGNGDVGVWCSRKSITISVDAKAKKLSVTIPPKATPGLCWIRLFNLEGVSALKPFIVGTLDEISEKEPNSRLSEAHRLETSKVVINGVLSKNGEVDTFAVELKKGETLVASMLANRMLASPMDGILQIVSPRGFVLEQNDDAFGFDPQIVFTAPQDGLYYVRTFAFPATPNSSIRFSGASSYVYRLTITTGPFVDHVFPLAFNRSTKYRRQLFGWNVPHEFNGIEISTDEKNETTVLHHPELANTLSLRVTPHSVAVEKEPNNAAAPQVVSIPVTLTGRIDSPGDVDSYRFSAKKGEKLLFRIESRKLGYPLDPVLRLFDSAGKLLKEQETRSKGVFDEQLAYTMPADGDYRLDVTDLHSAGGLRYVYLLTLEPQQPNYSLVLKADTFQITPGNPLEIPVTVTREYGFADEIKISIAALPDGLFAKPVLSKAKGATAKSVKLVLRANATVSFNAPVQLIGQSTGKSPMKRFAAAPVKDHTEKTRDIWLTVLPSKPVEAKKP